jgi:outer membrane protein assembly factor BamB
MILLRPFLFMLIATLGLVAPVIADDWPQWMGPERDGVWREEGIVETLPVGDDRVLWRVPIGGGYAGPAVVGERVYVTDKQLVGDARDPDNPFQRGSANATERVLCLDAVTGKVIWKYEYPCPYTVSYPAGPRTTPVVRDGRLYTLGAEGHLVCLDAETGELVWKRHFATDFGRETSPVWGYSANLLLDGDRLIALVGGKGTTVVAFHKNDGRELWRALDSTGEHGPGYSSPIILEAGGTRQLIVWHPAALSSLNPETGEVYWNQPFALQAGLAVATPRVQGNLLFVSSFYNGSLMMRLDRDKPTAEVAWQRSGKNERLTDSLHSIISTPALDGEFIYGVDSYGEFRCLDRDTGDRIWETFAPTSGQSARWGNAFLVRHEDRYFLFSEQGDLILAKLSPEKYDEIGRMHLIEPTGPAQRRDVVWTHPAFARKCVFARNDKEIVCVSLAKE